MFAQSVGIRNANLSGYMSFIIKIILWYASNAVMSEIKLTIRFSWEWTSIRIFSFPNNGLIFCFILSSLFTYSCLYSTSFSKKNNSEYFLLFKHLYVEEPAFLIYINPYFCHTCIEITSSVTVFLSPYLTRHLFLFIFKFYALLFTFRLHMSILYQQSSK